MVKDKNASVYFNREDNTFHGIDAQILKELSSVYDGIDIEVELKKMGLWLCSPKGIRRKGTIGFILNWLNNATPMPPTVTEQFDMMQSESPLGKVVREYLMGLWKDREHIYHFNTIRKKL